MSRKRERGARPRPGTQAPPGSAGWWSGSGGRRASSAPCPRPPPRPIRQHSLIPSMALMNCPPPPAATSSTARWHASSGGGGGGGQLPLSARGAGGGAEGGAEAAAEAAAGCLAKPEGRPRSTCEIARDDPRLPEMTRDCPKEDHAAPAKNKSEPTSQVW